jgi:hypothetical protein
VQRHNVKIFDDEIKKVFQSKQKNLRSILFGLSIAEQPLCVCVSLKITQLSDEKISIYPMNSDVFRIFLQSEFLWWLFIITKKKRAE